MAQGPRKQQVNLNPSSQLTHPVNFSSRPELVSSTSSGAVSRLIVSCAMKGPFSRLPWPCLGPLAEPRWPAGPAGSPGEARPRKMPTARRHLQPAHDPLLQCARGVEEVVLLRELQLQIALRVSRVASECSAWVLTSWGNCFLPSPVHHARSPSKSQAHHIHFPRSLCVPSHHKSARVAAELPELRRWQLRDLHRDVQAPSSSTSTLFMDCFKD